jgi:alkaline phosphatase
VISSVNSFSVNGRKRRMNAGIVLPNLYPAVGFSIFAKNILIKNDPMKPFNTLFLFVAFLLLPGTAVQAGNQKGLPRPKNVIIMIGDGMGYNHILAANYYLGMAGQVYESFPVRLANSHYPAKAGSYSARESGTSIWATGYNTVDAWRDTAYLKKNVTESAASGTALATGVKTYNNAVGIAVNGDTLVNLVEWAKNIGKSAGVVTSVPLSHATPACFVAHNVTRTNYAEIAFEMLLDSRCDVIMGCGNPMFDDNGVAVRDKWKNSKYLGDSAFWVNVQAGSGSQVDFLIKGQKKTVQDIDGDGKPDAWTVIQKVSEFDALGSGKTPKRLLGVPAVYSTLQQSRAMGDKENKNSPPFITPRNSSVPVLAMMTTGAINVLDNNPSGFFLMVEGGAIDWAGHANQKGRLIEEMQDFNEAVQAVVDWVNRNSSWDETLLIITADHETGLLWGEAPFRPLKDNGKGKLPVMEFNSDEHSNSLVPVFAKGSGSELYLRYADELDSLRGPYVQNSEIPQLIKFLWAE